MIALEKMAAAKRGKTISAETRARISAIKKSKRIPAIALAILLGITPTITKGQGLPTHDSLLNLNSAREWVRNAAEQVRAYGMQVRQLEQEVQAAQYLETQVTSTIQHPNLGAAMALLQRAGLSSALPLDPDAVQSLMSGTRSPSALASNVGRLANSQFDADFAEGLNCDTSNLTCQRRVQQAYAAAGANATGQATIQNMGQHVGVLEALRTRINEVGQDPGQREHIGLQLQAESAWAQQESARLQGVALMANAARDTRQIQEGNALDDGFRTSAQRAWAAAQSARGRGG